LSEIMVAVVGGLKNLYSNTHSTEMIARIRISLNSQMNGRTSAGYLRFRL